VDEGAKPFVSKLQSLLTSENSEMMLAQSRELLFQSIYDPGFANSFKIFLQTAYWYNDLTEYEDSPDY